MIGRVIAWALVIAFLWSLVHFGSPYRNPWRVVTSPVLQQLPPLPPGCGEACK